MGKLFKTSMMLLGGVCLFAASAGVTGAYLTSVPDELINIITPGEIKVKLTEPGWKPGEGKNLVPKSVISKDPRAVNTGKNEEWIFLKVSVPVRRLAVVDPISKKKQEAAETELFSFSALGGWTLVGRQKAEDVMEYIYGYEKAVKPGETTVPLFDEVTLVNYLEGELDAEDELKMPVEAMAIQSSVCPEGADIEAVYEEYLRQKGEDESAADTI